jgi:hypothetical protein
MIVPERWRWVLPIAVVLTATALMLVLKSILF